MIEGPLADDLHAASHFACRALEAQILAAGRALNGWLKPTERRKLRATCDYVARRVAVWRELLSDEPEIVAGLETLARRLQEFKPRRRLGNSTQSSLRKRR